MTFYRINVKAKLSPCIGHVADNNVAIVSLEVVFEGGTVGGATSVPEYAVATNRRIKIKPLEKSRMQSYSK